VTGPQITAALVTRLLAEQFPQWADLPVTPVELDGWDNRTFRLGDRMSVRLPSGEGYAAQVDKEQRWLPVLAPQLPLPGATTPPRSSRIYSPTAEERARGRRPRRGSRVIGHRQTRRTRYTISTMMRIRTTVPAPMYMKIPSMGCHKRRCVELLEAPRPGHRSGRLRVRGMPRAQGWSVFRAGRPWTAVVRYPTRIRTCARGGIARTFTVSSPRPRARPRCARKQSCTARARRRGGPGLAAFRACGMPPRDRSCTPVNVRTALPETGSSRYFLSMRSRMLR
jgi:hypothetical protein